MSTYSYNSTRSSGGSSKSSVKSLLFDSKTLQGMLGLTPTPTTSSKTLKTKADKIAKVEINICCLLFYKMFILFIYFILEA